MDAVSVLQTTLLWMSWLFHSNQTEKNIDSEFGSLMANKDLLINQLKDTNLIPRSLLFGSPDFSGVLLSPDGRYLSYMKQEGGQTDIWVAELPFDVMRGGKVPAGRKLTNLADSRNVNYLWAYDNRTILVMHDKSGDENFRLSKVDLETGLVTPLVQGDGVRVLPLKLTPLEPYKVAIGINDRDPRYLDPYILDIRTGRRLLVYRNNRFSGFVFDSNLRLRLASQVVTGGAIDYYSFDTGSGNITKYRTVEAEDTITTDPLTFDATGQLLYWLDSESRDLGALVETEFVSRREKTLLSPSRADITSSDIIVHPISRKPVLVEENYDRPKLIALDPTYRADIQFLRTVSSGDIAIASTTMDFAYWLVAYQDSKNPLKYYLYHQPTKTIRFLFNSWEAMAQYDLAPMTSLMVPTSDGLTELCYLTNPIEPVSQPPPMVLLVHGGPSARDYWGFSELIQFLANRGYAVLQCNYRGSTGFGKAYHNAGYGEWGRKMHKDLLDAVDAAVQRGLADPGKVAIMGGSYGGYATLVGLTKTPDAFACGVDIVGPANLFTLLETIPPYWETGLEDFYLKIGNPNTAEGRAMMRDSSPIFFVDNIVKPLLVGQGMNDPRVNKNESEQIVQAMKAKDIPVTYVSFPDEGHGFRKSANEMAFYGVMELFLQSCLGGRAEPLLGLGDSSMVVEEEGDLDVLSFFKNNRRFA